MKLIADIIKTYRQAFRVYVRRRTIPIPLEEAEEKRLFWSKMYFFFSFLILATVTGNLYFKGKNFDYRSDISKDKAVFDALVKSSESKRAMVFKGLTKVEEYNFTPSTEKTNITVDKLESTAES